MLTGSSTNLECRCRSVQTYCEMLLTLNTVGNSQHGDEWKCVWSQAISNVTTMFVNVPISAVQITSPVTSQVSVVEDVPYSFVCETSAGRPQAKVEWYKRSGSGTEVAIPGGSTSTESSGTLIITRSTLSYRATKADEGYRLYCKATNIDTIMVTSSSQPVMRILYAPMVQPIQNRNVLLASQLSVPCVTTAGNPPQTSYRWTKSGSSSWSQTGQTLGISRVEKTDAGDYTCTAWNVMSPTGGTQVNGEVSTTFTLNSLYAPVIQTIQNRDVVLFSPLTVQCVTTPGNPPQTTYRWTRNRGGSWSQTGQTLSISSVEKTDAGDYTCTAWNVMSPTGGTQVKGEVSTTFTMNVLYAPVIQTIQDRDVVLSSPLTVQCVTTPGYPTHTTYRWTRSGSSSWSQTGQTLGISRVEKTDAGDYTCTAWNVMSPTGGTQVKGEVSTTFTLNVLRIASQTVSNISPSPTATVIENNSTTLRCSYSENDVCPNTIPLFLWYLNDDVALGLAWNGTSCNKLRGNDTNLDFNCSSYQTYCEMLLTLNQVRRSQHGEKWKCESAETTIFVNVPISSVPLTSPVTSQVSVVEDVPYSFVCETSAGRPKATIQWYKRFGSGPEVAIPGGSTSTGSSGTLVITRSTLNYTATKADEGYQIYCKATNVGSITITSSRKPIMSVLYAPVIQTIQDKNVILSSPLSVQCVTTPGNPTQTTYRWTRSRDSWRQTGQTLSISRVEKTDAGNYTCTAWNVMNPTGVAQVNGEVSTTFTLVVLYAPMIQPIQDKDVVLSSPLSERCITTSGYPSQTTYRWTRSGDSWTRSGQTLSISRVEKTDAGVYTCTAGNVLTPTGGTSVKGEVSITFTLNVLYAPVIQAIQDKDVVLSSQLSVQCVTTPGNPPQTSYKWTRSGSSSWSQSGQTLSISRVQKTDAGGYTCTAWNVMTPTGGPQVNGTVSNTFTLNVLYAPVIQIIQNRDIILSSQLSVPCVTTAGNPPQTSYRWTRSGSSSWSQNGQTLSISRVEKNDASVYTCTAWNVLTPTGGTQINGEDSTTFTLNVLYKASITSFKVSEETGGGPYTVDENSRRTFRCDVDSNPFSTITITRADGAQLAHATNAMGVTFVKTFVCIDTGKYKCTSYNNFNGGVKPTEELELFVRCHPRASDIIEPTIILYKALHESVTLDISITAYPQPTYTWFKAIPSRSGGWTRISVDEKTYTIDTLQEADFLQYKVEVTNGIAPDFVQFFEIAARGKSEPPMNIEVISEYITSSTALIQWSPGFNGGLPQVFHIEYKRKEDLTWTDTAVVNETVKYKTITNLVPGTHYMVRMYSSNTIGKSLTTNTLEFQTLTAESLPSESTPLGGIIGGVVAGVVVIAVIAAAAAFVIRRLINNRRGDSEHSTNGNTQCESEELKGFDHQCYNVASTNESTDSQPGSSSQTYENLRRAPGNPEMYDVLHQEKAVDTTNESNVYENMKKKGKKGTQDDGVYEEFGQKADKHVNDDDRIYVNFKRK